MINDAAINTLAYFQFIFNQVAKLPFILDRDKIMTINII